MIPAQRIQLSQGERRLAAIMFTDIVDYTIMSQKNETLALTLLEEHRQILRPAFARRGGREVKTIGDGFLVEFPSALEAVRCALEIQQLMKERNQSVPSESKILLRVGVHLGDVEHRNGDVYGDAVNTASRVQSLAEPGGVSITQQVFDHVRNNEEFRAVALGQNQLKNVQTPTEVYRVLPSAERTKLTKIEVRTEVPIWDQKYDRELEDVFKIQTDIAERVADALKVQLLTENRTLIEQKAPDDIGAYVLYLRGRYYSCFRLWEDLERAIGYFGEAIRHDPKYALAYAGEAECDTLMGRHLYLPPKDAFLKAREYANRALELNDNLAEAHTSLAAVPINYNWDWNAAEEQFKHALHLNPNYAAAHYWHSVLLQTTGRLQESITAAEKAQVLDPLSPVIGMGVVQAYFFSEQYDKAIDECRKYLEMNPNF